jgi:hypothetical protein
MSDTHSESGTDEAVPVEPPVLRPVPPWAVLDRSLPQFDYDELPIPRVTSLAGDGVAVSEIIGDFVPPFPLDVEVVAVPGLVCRSQI